jgi:hypothetical protein
LWCIVSDLGDDAFGFACSNTVRKHPSLAVRNNAPENKKTIAMLQLGSNNMQKILEFSKNSFQMFPNIPQN